MGRSTRSTRSRGVTLLEVTLAMGLLVVLTSMTYWFYSSALETREKGTIEARKLRLARVVLDRIANEIRQASMITAGGRLGIRGEPERIWLSSLRVPTRDRMALRRSMLDEPPPPQSDMVKVEYRIARHPDVLDDDGYERALGLARVEHKVPRPNSAESGEAYEDRSGGGTSGFEGLAGGAQGQGKDAAAGPDETSTDEELFDEEDDAGNVGLGPDINWEELYAPEIHHLRFCYFDGYKWWNSWEVQGENPLPQLVMVVIGFEGHPAFGEELCEREEEEFCDCLNEEEEQSLECEPLASDQFSTMVRVPQADTFFRSRVTRETQAFLDEFSSGTEEDDGSGEDRGGE